MSSSARYLAFAIIGLVVMGSIVALRGDLTQISFAPLLRSWDLVALAALLSLGNYALRILRWQRYLARLGHSLSLGFTALTYVAGFAFTLSPGKVGELVRARYYSRANVPLADVAGAFFMERIMDLVAMIALATLILNPVSRYRGAVGSMAGLVVLVLLILLVGPWKQVLTRMQMSTQLPHQFTNFFSGAANALVAARALLSPGMLVSGFGISLVAWGLEGLGLCALAGMFPNVALGVAAGTGIYAIAILVGAMSFLPAGLGTTEALMTALLTAQGFSLPEAIVVTIACRLVTLWLAVAMGWAAVALLRQRPQEVMSW